MSKKTTLNIILVGGGTAGSVSPLLAVKDAVLKLEPNTKFYFFGTRSGTEKILVEKENLKFYSIPAGKWRRYFSIRNFFDIFLVLFGFIRSLYLLRKIKADIVLSAGSFVSVPVSFAAFILRKKIFLHQQDLLPSFSNKLIFPFANKLSVSLEESQRNFSNESGFFKKIKKQSKIIYTGNPVRANITSGNRKRALKEFGLESNFPTILVLGGSSGAATINKLILESIGELTKYFQVIHVIGKHKVRSVKNIDHYHPYDFLTANLPDAFKIADIVVSRAGFSTITELSACKKVSVIIPMPKSHQIANANYLFFKRAAVAIRQETLNPKLLITFLRKLLFDYKLQILLRENIANLMPVNASEKLAKQLITLVKNV
ncbi:MAG: hypothetical protein COT91_03695 [Candidatus Doudnabacteria bacterium CG10_big_fil_rev_8_21_14_0_10_41_10]|uniref:UDP-N-acetylglucosamine--N-acetylmuramyl-(pentapeptide) pyrophosphoryl-undecaprenol N-acetylglucosamine transferase n=1 Tax=Candidatus Doudnabacteria bacterium CG10_big_fil_rev_8_21_14_0_10_41_10 TaxID=1974551 RepID=A0A2H0VFD7_9BACT|nr:MAG: hypothetical protein COT91_03695 [Candidatus Doudnabacteria bacterium CG10_big_fil_rev_8_21_14_0_10_41_10]